MVSASGRYYCPQCGYDLRGQTVERCPECGFGYDRPALESLASVAANECVGYYLSAIPSLVAGLVFVIGGCLRRLSLAPVFVLLLCMRPLWRVVSCWVFGRPGDALRFDAAPWTTSWFVELALSLYSPWGVLAYLIAVFMLFISEASYLAFSAAVIFLGAMFVVFAGVRHHRMDVVGQVGLLTRFEGDVLRRARTATWLLVATDVLGLAFVALRV